MKKTPVIIAHRGYSAKYPDNTVLAFEMAGRSGAGGAETDIRVTSDGVYVCCHNDDVAFADGTSLPVEGHTLAELRQKPLENDESGDTVYLATFREYLTVMKKYGMICFIELKGPFTTEEIRGVFDLAGEVYDLDRCILQSFDFDNLIKAREQFPDLPIMLTYGVDDTGYERCFEYGFSIDADYRCVTEEMVKEFHDRGLEFAVWTANELLSLNYSKSLGVDYIESDVF